MAEVKTECNGKFNPCNIQNIIDILIFLDFVISTVGGIVKANKPEIANYCFMSGGLLLAFAVILTGYKLISKKK